MSAKICPVCGKQFVPYHENQKYCSVACRDFKTSENVLRPLVEHTCIVCGKVYMAQAGSVYCSTKCKGYAYRRRHGKVDPAVGVQKVCEYCGKEYTTSCYNTTRQMYCSPECREAAKKKKRAEMKAQGLELPKTKKDRRSQASANRANLVEDARKAREAGVSYGKYKASFVTVVIPDRIKGL